MTAASAGALAAPPGASAPTPLVVLTRNDTPPRFDTSRITEALGLYAEGSRLVLHALDAPGPETRSELEALVRSRMEGLHAKRAVWWEWSPAGDRFTVHLMASGSAVGDDLAFSVDYPSAPTADFYRQVALKLRTLLHVLGEESAMSTAPAPVAPRAPRPSPSPKAARHSTARPVRLTAGIFAAGLLPTDTWQPAALFGLSAGLEWQRIGIELSADRSLGAPRSTTEGRGTVTLSSVVVSGTLSLTWSAVRIGPVLGAGIVWAQATGQLTGQAEQRSGDGVLPMGRLGVRLALSPVKGFEVALVPEVDLFFHRTRIFLHDTMLFDSGWVLPRLDLELGLRL